MADYDGWQGFEGADHKRHRHQHNYGYDTADASVHYGDYDEGHGHITHNQKNVWKYEGPEHHSFYTRTKNVDDGKGKMGKKVVKSEVITKRHVVAKRVAVDPATGLPLQGKALRDFEAQEKAKKEAKKAAASSSGLVKKAGKKHHHHHHHHGSGEHHHHHHDTANLTVYGSPVLNVKASPMSSPKQAPYSPVVRKAMKKAKGVKKSTAMKTKMMKKVVKTMKRAKMMKKRSFYTRRAVLVSDVIKRSYFARGEYVSPIVQEFIDWCHSEGHGAF